MGGRRDPKAPTPRQRDVLEFACEYFDSNGQKFPSQNQIAQGIGASQANISTLIKGLEQKGYVGRRRQDGVNQWLVISDTWDLTGRHRKQVEFVTRLGGPWSTLDDGLDEYNFPVIFDRVAGEYVTKDEYDRRRREDYVHRECLKCGRRFMAEHRFKRLCEPCRKIVWDTARFVGGGEGEYITSTYGAFTAQRAGFLKDRS